MYSCNANMDPEYGRISMCLSHLRRGEAQVAALGGGVYEPEVFAPMPRPLRSNGVADAQSDLNSIAQRRTRRRRRPPLIK